jgi:putative cardiolipin synthase
LRGGIIAAFSIVPLDLLVTMMSVTRPFYRSRRVRNLPWLESLLTGPLARLLSIVLGAGGLLAISGCASLPADPPRQASYALAPETTGGLGAMATAAIPKDGRSGFALLPVSSVAYTTRVDLIRKAEHSLDLQYYLFQADGTGLSLMRELRGAALRGVRVRLLVDDLYTGGEDPLLRGLAAYPNVEIRLFNPFVVGRFGLYSRLVFSAGDSARVNHRMHNKLFVADGVMAVCGGRNIADEYFMHSSRSNFVDLDVFMVGPVVGQLESIFDTYWNSAYAYPLDSIITPARDAADARAGFNRLVADAQGPPHEDLGAPFQRYDVIPAALDSGRLGPLTLATGEAFADPVDKAGGAKEDSYEGTVTGRVIEVMNEATQGVSITSPYFVPGDKGVAMMKAGHAAGGRVTVLTNSLASTDEPAVYAGYAQYRKAMLEAGIELRELSPMLARNRRHFGDFGKSMGSLHAKAVTIDGKLLYVGSMNLDPRSAYHNTELGLFIDSPALVKEVTSLIDEPSLYRLRLSDDGQIQWVAQTEEGEIIYNGEPETNWWMRTKAWLLSLIVPANQI